MDMDDDLPPPPPRTGGAAGTTITLDDSDDDLPPPPKVAAAAPVVVVLDDDDDDLPPPPKLASVAKSAAVEDFDDDLPPPPKPPVATSSPQRTPAAPPEPAAPPPPAAAAPESPSRPTPTIAAPEAASSPVGSRPRSSVVVEPAPHASSSSSGNIGTNSGEATVETRGRSATAVAKQKATFKDGMLLKQQPTWPYTAQNRWCVLSNRQLSYYDSKESAAAGGKPHGTLDLKDAHVRSSADDIKASRPHSFGIEMSVDPHASGKGSSGRTYIFSALSLEEFNSWIHVLETVCGSAKGPSELHWFEKLAQGTF